MFEIVPFEKKYAEQVVDLFEDTHAATNGVYPPSQAFANRLDLKSWIFSGSGFTERLIAIGNKRVLGHIAIRKVFAKETSGADGEIFQYWKKAFPTIAEAEYADYLEITKLAVSPDQRNQGLGTVLLQRAREAIEASGKFACLVVIESLKSPRALYEKEGGENVCIFEAKYRQKVASYLFPPR